MAAETPHRIVRNVPGPFYSTRGCTACGAPEAEAPDLLAPLDDNNHHTYFIRQPATPDEVERACRAIEVCCLSALRHGGTDSAIIRRLGNRVEYCDHVLPGGPIRLASESDAQWAAARALWRRATALVAGVVVSWAPGPRAPNER
jgi:hypothetical protein